MKHKETIHIGQLIRQKLQQEERSGAWLARKLSMDASNVSKILQKRYIDTDLLMRISEILNEDFFAKYSTIYRLKKESADNDIDDFDSKQ